MSVQTVPPVSDDSRLFDKFVDTKSSPERIMLAKVVYEVGKSDAFQSLHFYHSFILLSFLKMKTQVSEITMWSACMPLGPCTQAFELVG
jgi:hypothetical protein